MLNQQLIEWKRFINKHRPFSVKVNPWFHWSQRLWMSRYGYNFLWCLQIDNSYRNRLIVKLPLKKFFLIGFHMVDKAKQFYLSYKLRCCTEISPEKSRNNTRKKFSSSVLILIISSHSHHLFSFSSSVGRFQHL